MKYNPKAYSILVLLFAIGISTNAISQGTSALKLNAQFAPFSNLNPKFISADQPIFRWAFPSLSWQGKSKKREKEIGIQYFQRNLNTSADLWYTEEYEGSVSFDVRNIKSKHKPLYVVNGIGVRTYYYHGDYLVNTTTAYPSEYTSKGLAFSGKPVLRYGMSKRLFLEASAEFLNLGIQHDSVSKQDPTLLERQRKAAGIDVYLHVIGRMFLSLGCYL